MQSSVVDAGFDEFAFASVHRSDASHRQTWNMYRGFEDRVTGDLLFVPESEESLFRHVGLPYLQPKDRV